MNYYSELDDRQYSAVSHFRGPALVLAGPGSGKTRVITYRTLFLIEECKVSPSEILVVTFTRAAAGEMKHRFDALSGGRYPEVTFGTFHSVFFGILRHAYNFRADGIVKSEQQYTFLKEQLKKQKIEIENEDENEFVSDLLSEISRVKNTGEAPAGYVPKCCTKAQFVSLFGAYDRFLQQNHLIDFDDMMIYCQDLFRQRPDILKIWQKKFRFMMIDEFQDINPIQYAIVRMLAEGEENLFVVGDDDQSIYGFRGSSPELMLGFEKVYPKAVRILLDRNYRSTAQIVNDSMMLIRQNDARFLKKMQAVRGDGMPVLSHVFETQELEYDCIADKLKTFGEKGGDYSQIAILYRTNTQAAGLVRVLMERAIPFRIRDKIPNMYEHWIARHIMAYIRLALGSDQRTDLLLVMNRPKRYITRDALSEDTFCFEELEKLYDDKPWILERIEQLERDLKTLRRMKPFAAIHFIRNIIGYEDYLKEFAEYRGVRVEEFLEIYEEIQEEARNFDSFDAWFKWIDEYSEELKRQAEQQSRGERGRTTSNKEGGSGISRGEKDNPADKPAVVITTMHGSKGLEYSTVFLPDLQKGNVPHHKAQTEEEIEEERRLFYVAMTRAKDALYMFAAKERAGRRTEISPFYIEAGGTLSEDNKRK